MQETRACKKCGAEFSFERKRRSGRARLFCSATCKAERLADLNAQYRREGRYRTRPHAEQRAKIAKTCVICGIGFATAKQRTRCCGRVCGRRLGKPRAGAARAARAEMPQAHACQSG